MIFRFLILGLPVLAASAALAQTTPAPDPKATVYTYAEQMPTLADGRGGAAISAAVQQRASYPPRAIKDRVEGRVFVSFVVTATGEVQHARVVRGVRADLDSAVVGAVRQLPTLLPGRQKGQPVAVSLTVPVNFRLQALMAPPDLRLQDPDHPEKVSDKVYTYVEQMPQLPGGGGNRAIVEAIQRKLVYPPEALRKGVEGRVIVGFTVATTGRVENPRIVQGIGSGCDEAVLAAVQQLPRLEPGRQQGQPVSVSFAVPVMFKLPAAPPAKGK